MDERYIEAEALLQRTYKDIRDLERRLAAKEITSEEFRRETAKLHQIKEQAEIDREYALSC